MEKIALYPGTFDPITLGHVDIIKRASRLFDRLLVGVAANQSKSTWLELDQRIALIKAAVPDIEVVSFDGLLVDFLKTQGASIVVRGLRNAADLALEQQLDGMNKAMMPGVETVWLNTNPEYQHISSSIVREVAKLGGDISSFVPNAVVKAFQ